MEVCLKLDNIKRENRPYAEVSPSNTSMDEPCGWYGAELLQLLVSGQIMFSAKLFKPAATVKLEATSQAN